jgi:excisionase family DNA binding protein
MAPTNSDDKITVNDGVSSAPSSAHFEPLLDSAEAAKLLQIHPKTLQKMARANAVPAHLICGLWRFRASELDQWLRNAVSSKSHSCSN